CGSRDRGLWTSCVRAEGRWRGDAADWTGPRARRRSRPSGGSSCWGLAFTWCAPPRGRRRRMTARRRETIRPAVLHPGGPAGPSGLRRLGSDAPGRLFVHGETTLLRAPLVGLFCSQRVPGRAVVQALELAEALAQAGASVVSR